MASDTVQVGNVAYPDAADVVSLEFMVYEIGNWTVACEGGKCVNSKLSVYFSNHNVEVALDTFDKGGAGTVEQKVTFGIKWSKSLLTASIMKVSMMVPKSLLPNNEVAFDMVLSVDSPDIGVGVDDVRITAYAESCKLSPARENTVTATRKLVAEAEADTCECICPDIGTEGPAPTSIVMDLFTEHGTTPCEPQGKSIGTLTVSPNIDGTVSAKVCATNR